MRNVKYHDYVGGITLPLLFGLLLLYSLRYVCSLYDMLLHFVVSFIQQRGSLESIITRDTKTSGAHNGPFEMCCGLSLTALQQHNIFFSYTWIGGVTALQQVK